MLDIVMGHAVRGAAISYIEQIIGNPASGAIAQTKSLERLADVPVWVNDAARFTEINLAGGYHFILVEPRDEMSADRLLSLYRQCQAVVPIPVILVTDGQTPHVRSALMRARIGLVRSGQMLFAPQFGTHFKGKAPSSKVSVTAVHDSIQINDKLLVPREQILMVTAILHPQLRQAESLTELTNCFAKLLSESGAGVINPSEFLSVISQALRHFQKRNLVSLHRSGKELHITFADAKVLWSHLCRYAQPIVTHVMPAFCDPKKLGMYPKAGLSALNEYSDLLPPKNPVVAMRRPDWLSWSRKEGARKVQETPTGFIEIWRLNPRYMMQGKTVNPLLLALNCRRDPDERVRIAVQEMLEKIGVDPGLLWSI
jgi:hypothetical protein